MTNKDKKDIIDFLDRFDQNIDKMKVLNWNAMVKDLESLNSLVKKYGQDNKPTEETERLKIFNIMNNIVDNVEPLDDDDNNGEQ